jgi:hypothetical protein
MAPGDLVVTPCRERGGSLAELPLVTVASMTESSTARTKAAEVTPAVDDSTLDRVAVLVPDAQPDGRS